MDTNSFLGCSSSDKFHRNHNPTTILIWGLLLGFLFVSIGFVPVSPWGEFDNDGFQLPEKLISWLTSQLFFNPLTLGFEQGIIITLMLFQYLTSHIGEKLPANLITKSIKFLIHAGFAMTALSNSAVILLFCSLFPIV